MSASRELSPAHSDSNSSLMRHLSWFLVIFIIKKSLSIIIMLQVDVLKMVDPARVELASKAILGSSHSQVYSVFLN